MKKEELKNRIQKNLAGKELDASNIMANIERERTSFYQHVLNYECGINDEETSIVKKTAANEKAQKGTVKIDLLGTSMKPVRAMDANDFRKVNKTSTYGKYHFLQNPASMLYYVKDSAKWPRPERMFKKARYSKYARVIIDWRQNADKRVPNTLLVTEQLLKDNPAFAQMIAGLGKLYQPRPTDAILLTGNLAAIRELLPPSAGAITTITLDAIADYAASVPSQQFTNKVADTLRYTLANREASMNELEKMKMLASNFVDAYAEASLIDTPNQAMMDAKPSPTQALTHPPVELPEQQLVSGKSDTPEDPVNINAEASHDDEPKSNRDNDFTPQRRVDYDTPDTPIPVEGEATHRNDEPPEMKAKTAPQVKIKAPDTQLPIDGDASHDGEPKSNRDNDFTPQRRVDYDTPDTQQPIDGEASRNDAEPPEMKGKTAPQVKVKHEPITEQHLINAEANDKRLPDAEPLKPGDTDPQKSMSVKKELAEPTRPDMTSIIEQHLIDAEANDKRLLDTEPLKPGDTDPQKCMSVKKELAEPTRPDMTSIIEQHLIDAEANDKHLPEAEPLKPDETEPQQSLSVDKELAEPTRPDMTTMTEQYLIDAEAQSNESAPLQIDETYPQQLISVKKESSERSPPTEISPQFFIKAEAQSSSTPDARLLDASKKLAEAMQKMLQNVEDMSQKSKNRPHELSQAASLISAANSELAPARYVVKLPEQQSANHVLRESIFEAARQLVSGLEQLNVACRLLSSDHAEVLKPKHLPLKEHKKE